MEYDYEEVEDFNESAEYTDEEFETYSEVDTDEDWTVGDTVAILGVSVGLILAVLIVAKIIKKNFKNLHIKVGAVEVGLDTKE